MHKLLFATTLIAPFLIGSALAQDPPATEAPADPPATEAPAEPAMEEQVEETAVPEAPADPAVEERVEDTAAPEAQPESEAIVREQAPNELRVDWITGTRVYSLDGESIGRITDLIFDDETHEIRAAILSVGGFLGIGAKDIAVKFEELVIDFDAREIRLDLTREAADAAPQYVFRERVQRPIQEPIAPAPAPLD